MYQPRTRPFSKKNPHQRWALPDRVFFACGACHILAHAFLERYGSVETYPLWFKPRQGFTGNQIVVTNDVWVFDYHGYSCLSTFRDHCFRRAQVRWPGWNAELVELPRSVLISEADSRNYDGLWLREPKQFLHDALPRARAFLDRFGAPPDTKIAGSKSAAHQRNPIP